MEVSMKGKMNALLVAAGLVLAGPVAAQISLFQDDGFHGRELRADRPVENFADRNFNDAVSSAEVRGGAWQVCTDAYFQGRCIVLRPGNYPSLRSLGLNDQVSSVRPLEQYGESDERGYRDRGPYAGPAWDRSYDDRYYDRHWDSDGDRYRGQ